MQRLTEKAMRDLGGTTAVANLVKAPVSTVHSWKRTGITESRLHHLKLAAADAGLTIDWATALEAMPSPHAALDMPDDAEISPGKSRGLTDRVAAARQVA